MFTLIQLILLVGVAVGLAYYRPAITIWLSAMTFVFVILSVFGTLSWWFLLPLWVIFLGIGAIFAFPSLQRTYLTLPVLKFFRRVLPPISRTEREALDAGDVWWEKDLFCGQPDWKKFLQFSKPELTAEEQAFLDNQVETLCSMINDWEIIQHEHNLPPKVWAYLKKEHFFGMVIPKEYGGLGFSALAHSSVIIKIATRSCSAAVNTMVPNSLGPGELLLHYGTEQQKQHYLPRLASGKDIPCFALTGQEAGSDAGSMTDTGVVCKGMWQGKEIIGLRLNWDKRYITLAPIATVLGLAFKMSDPDKLLGDTVHIGITLCLIPADHPGVEIGTRHSPMGMVFINGPIRGKDVFIPLDWIIGGPEMAGQGWHMLMECLSIGRSISLPALSTATGQFAYRATGAYARLRRQFKLPIGHFEGVEEAMARIGGHTYMLNATRAMTAHAVDQGIKPAIASAIAKYHMTEMLRKVINDAMDIHGGRGIQMGPRNYLAYGYQAAPVAITVEGANILTRCLIIFGQGAMRCHPYLRQEMLAAEDTDTERGTTAFGELLSSHIAYAVSNFSRSFVLGLTGATFIDAPVTGPTADYYQQLTRMSTALALVSDIAMLTLGGDLKRKERLSARLGDVLSALYLASAVLKYYEEQKAPADDLPYVHWTIQTLLHQMQIAFDEFFVNFPQRWLGRILRFVVFPYGTSYKAPADQLGHQIARSMMQSSELRDRMTDLCYVGTGKDDPIWRVEHAFQLVLATDAIRKKQKEGGVLTADEEKLLQECEVARWDAIQVDEFSFDYFKRA